MVQDAAFALDLPARRNSRLPFERAMKAAHNVLLASPAEWVVRRANRDDVAGINRLYSVLFGGERDAEYTGWR